MALIKRKTQTSALSAKHPELEGTSYDEQCFILAKHAYDRILKYERSALLAAKECGAWLNRAKKKWKRRRENRWLWKLKKVFTWRGVRSVQIYMRIAERWKEIEPLRKDNPNLSIAAADRFLSTGQIAKSSKKFDPYAFEQSRILANVKRTWCKWHKQVQKWLFNDPELLEEFFIKVVLKCAPRDQRRRYLPKHAIAKLDEVEELERKLRPKLDLICEEVREERRSAPRRIDRRTGKKKYSSMVAFPGDFTHRLLSCECDCDACRYRRELGPMFFATLWDDLENYEEDREIHSQDTVPADMLLN